MAEEQANAPTNVRKEVVEDDSIEEEPDKKPTKHQLKMMQRKQEKDAKKPKTGKGLSKKKVKAQEKIKLKAELSKKAFNEFYVSQFGAQRWPTLLKALERPTRYCCMINKYATKESVSDSLDPIMSKLKQVPYISIPCYYRVDDNDEDFPFPQPSRDDNGTTNYYLLDAASLLATEALDVKPHEVVLDMCAAPGGKSLSILQRLNISDGGGGSLVCNEMSSDRRKRLKAVIKQYIPEKERTNVNITSRDGTTWHSVETDHYDKILVDAPCSSDRHVVHDPEEMNSWNPSRTRIQSRRQFALLTSAIKAVREGGTIVYATCSMSAFENDNVVEKAVRKTRFNVVVDTSKKWPIGEATKYGWIVLPDSGDRWGPLYFAVIKRLDGEKGDFNVDDDMDDEDAYTGNEEYHDHSD